MAGLFLSLFWGLFTCKENIPRFHRGRKSCQSSPLLHPPNPRPSHLLAQKWNFGKEADWRGGAELWRRGERRVGGVEWVGLRRREPGPFRLLHQSLRANETFFWASLCRNSLTTTKPLNVESSVFWGVIEVRKPPKNNKNKKNEKMMSC